MCVLSVVVEGNPDAEGDAKDRRRWNRKSIFPGDGGLWWPAAEQETIVQETRYVADYSATGKYTATRLTNQGRGAPVCKQLFPLIPPAANMNAPHGDTGVLVSPATNLSNAVLNSKVSELACVCVGLGMAPPEFSYIRNRQVTQWNARRAFAAKRLKLVFTFQRLH